MRIEELYRQLRDRRVIRATVIYLAVLWAALQAADLFAGADILSESAVRRLIVAGVGGIPVVVIASWFLESPWRERRWTAVAGDALVIVAVSLAAGLFAWQQWFVSFARPTLAVLAIEATDTRDETADLADHLSKRLRMILATRPEVRVIESGSSLQASLSGLQLADKAAALGTDFLVAGTLSRGDQSLRLSLQLFDHDGDLLWSDRVEGPWEYQEQFQQWTLEALWPQLPLPADALDAAQKVVAACPYPDRPMAVLTLARTGRRGGGPAALAMVATADIDAGLLHLAQARFYFDQVDRLPAPERPVTQQLAMRALTLAKLACPDHPEVELLRLVHTRELQLDVDHSLRYLSRHPNSAELYLQLAELHHEAGIDRRARAFANEALLLDPLGAATQCRARSLLQSRQDDGNHCP